MFQSFKRWVHLSALIAALLLLATGLVQSQEQNTAEKARLKKLDSGARVIDVSHYAEAQKTAYALMSKRCVKCHALGRVVNTTFVLPEQWERYIKRMLNKPDSKISEDEAKTIYRFMVYDASMRKLDSLRVHLAALPSEDREKSVEKIHALNPGFSLGK